MGTLFAVSDLHVSHSGNRQAVEGLTPTTNDDWLIVCGDSADDMEDVEWVLSHLAARFKKVIWTPGNHELHTYPGDGDEPRGEYRYLALVEICRDLGVITPEDPYPIWEGSGGPAVVAPLFLLYDYSFGVNISSTKEDSLRRAYDAGVVCSDEFLLHPDPHPSRERWCHARVEISEARLMATDSELPTVLVNHFPLIDAPTRALRHPEFAQWCGTSLTGDWHRRFRATAVVYGHLHIPRTTWHDEVRFEEVSLGYPREWSRRRNGRAIPRAILPGAAA